MPTLGEILGNKKSTLVDFPENFCDRYGIYGMIDFQSFKTYEDGDIYQTSSVQITDPNMLIRRLETTMERAKRLKRGKITVAIRYKRRFTDNYVDLYHGEISQQLIDEFKKVFEKDGKNES